jgi:hypothetical protein
VGPPPFDANAEVLRIAEHAPVPTSREEVKRFIYVLEMMDDGLYHWRGEWLSHFPQYVRLHDRDRHAWNAWLSRPETDRFLDETVERCRELSEMARQAIGYAVLDVPDEERTRPGGWAAGSLKKLSEREFELFKCDRSGEGS